MSEKRKVIHVKDLVIKADNVYIEPRRRRHDPFWGPRMDEREEDAESSNHEDHDDEDRDGESGDDRRPPFSWI